VPWQLFLLATGKARLVRVSARR